MIERSHLLIVAALHEHGTLTRAAEELCVSQSALSHAMHKLEDQLGCSLWRKNGRILHLTEAGTCLLELSQRVLPLLVDGERVLRHIAEGTRGSLRIGIECHPCYTWLLKMVSGFLEAWPEVELDVTERFQFDGTRALLNRQIDILVTPDAVEHDALVYKPALHYELKLVAKENHTLRTHRSGTHVWANPPALKDQVLLTFPVSPERLDVFTRFLVPAGIEPARHKAVETTEIMLELVAAGRGVTTLPDYLIHEYQQSTPIQAMRLGKSGLHKTLWLAVRKNDPTTPYIADFLSRTQ